MGTRYVVYGAGAIGSAIGGHLFRTGHETVLVGRPAHVSKIRSDGLQLVTPAEAYRLAAPAVSSAAEVGFRQGDVVLLCVKSQHTDGALAEIRGAGGNPQTLPILCCQNSVTNEPAAVRFYRRVYGVLVVVTGIFLEPGVVHNPVRGNAGVLEVGRFPEGLDDLTAEVEGALSKASFGAWANPRVMDAKGAKLLGNLGNSMGAITDGTGDPRAYMAVARAEAEACLTAAGIPYEARESFDARMKRSRGVNELPAGLRNLGSTWQSLMRGTGDVEADYLNGEIVRLGRLHGIRTPHNEVLQELSNRMAACGEKPGRYTAQDLEELVRSRT